MKRCLLLTVTLLILMSNFGIAESDTVWVKKIGSEVLQVKFSPDGQFIYAAAIGRKPMKLSTETGEILKEYEGVTIDLNARYIPLDISSDGTFLISGDYDNKMIVWDAQTGNLLKTLNTNYSSNQNNKFNVVSISKDMRYVIATNMYWQSSEIFVNSLLIWDYQSGELLKEIQSRHLTKIEISPDNKYFAVSYERSEGSTILPSEVDLYEMGTWNKVSTLGKHETKVSDISFSPDGSLLASCGWDGIIKIWDVEQKKLVKQSQKFKKFISVKFITNEIVIGGANDDFSSDLYTWELSNNKQYTTIPISRPNSIEHSSAKSFIAIADYKSVTLLNYDKIVGVNEFPKSKIKYFPNPLTNNSILNIIIAKSDNYNISIYDSNSKIISLVHNGYLAEGTNKFNLNTTQYSNGTYFCRITNKNYSETLKIIIEK